jgi:hypothetical protein
MSRVSADHVRLNEGGPQAYTSAQKTFRGQGKREVFVGSLAAEQKQWQVSSGAGEAPEGALQETTSTSKRT